MGLFLDDGSSNENCIIDELGGVHDEGLGWDPDGDFCGECSEITCVGCGCRESENLDEPQSCWFCLKDNGRTNDSMYFTWEWDSYFHLECLIKALEEDPENPEALIIMKEFDLF